MTALSFFFSNSADDILVSPVHQPPVVMAGMVNGAGVKGQDIT